MAVLVILAVVVVGAILFFWLFDVDAGVQEGNVDVDVDVREVNADVDAPAVDGEAGDAPDVDVEGGRLPDVDVRPADEPDNATSSG